MGLFNWVSGLFGGRAPRVRRYAVTLFGEPLGTFMLPTGGHMPNPPAVERLVFTRPFKVDMPYAGYLYFFWAERYPDGRFKVVTWHPDTPELRDEANRFFNAAHGLRHDGTPDPDRRHPLPTRTVEETRLIRAALADWTNDGPLRDYADWLTARGDAYGEYIRLTLDIEALPETDPRRERLEERRQVIVLSEGPRWVLPLADLGLYPGVHLGDFDGYFPEFFFGKRGVVEELDVPNDARVFPAGAAGLFYGAPFLRKLSVNNLDLTVADFAALPQMAQIESLSLMIGAGTADDYRRFAESPHLTGLRELKLTGMAVGPAGAEHLARAPWLAHVLLLDLTACALGDAGAEALAGSPHAVGLATLALDNNGITSRGLTALAESPHLTSLTGLHVGGSFDPGDGSPRPGYTAAAVRALGSSAFARSLRSLTLDHNIRSAEVAEALASCPLPALKRLAVASCPLGPAGVTALVRAPWVRQLELFAAGAAEGGDDAAQELSALGFTELRELDLSGNRLTDAGATALVRSKAVTKLRKLSLAHNPIGPAGVSALAGADLPALEELDLSDVPCGPAGAKALAASPHLKHLKRLIMSAEHVGLTGRDALVHRFTDQVVTIYG